MPPDLIPRYSPETGLNRRAPRGLPSLHDQVQLTSTQIDAEAEVQACTAQALSAVAGQAMQAGALLSQMQPQPAQTMPLASGRHAAIADIAALALAQIGGDVVASCGGTESTTMAVIVLAALFLALLLLVVWLPAHRLNVQQRYHVARDRRLTELRLRRERYRAMLRMLDETRIAAVNMVSSRPRASERQHPEDEPS
jgi:hypothetical protein